VASSEYRYRAVRAVHVQPDRQWPISWHSWIKIPGCLCPARYHQGAAGEAADRAMADQHSHAEESRTQSGDQAVHRVRAARRHFAGAGRGPSLMAKRLPYRIGRSATGFGLFATEPIAKGAFIVEYSGPRIPTKEAQAREARTGCRYMFEIN